MERMVAISLKDGRNDKFVLLIDYEGFSIAKSPHMKTSLETLHILQNHYPERLHCAYCIRYLSLPVAVCVRVCLCGCVC